MRSARNPWLAALLLCGATACGAPAPEGPITAVLSALAPGEAVVYVRIIEANRDAARPAGAVAVVRRGDGLLALRIFEKQDPESDAGGPLSMVHSAPGGERFRNLNLIDVDADGMREIVATWDGGHLTILDVIGRQADGAYRSIFQNAGREVEIRYGAGGSVGFLITSRTYEETPGQPPVLESELYRWDGTAFSASAR